MAAAAIFHSTKTYAYLQTPSVVISTAVKFPLGHRRRIDLLLVAIAVVLDGRGLRKSLELTINGVNCFWRGHYLNELFRQCNALTLTAYGMWNDFMLACHLAFATFAIEI